MNETYSFSKAFVSLVSFVLDVDYRKSSGYLWRHEEEDY